MSIDRIKGAVAFFCDLGGCDNSIETGESQFGDAILAAKDEGWKIRNRDGIWKHFCCDRHQEMDWRGQKIARIELPKGK